MIHKSMTTEFTPTPAEKAVRITLTKKKVICSIVIIAVVAIVLLSIFYAPFANYRKKIFTRTPVWYAVHLNNGHVYYGQLKSVEPETITLKKTYLLESAPNQPQVYNLNLRGKRDPLILTDSVLFINRAAVLFWEKMTPDSQVVQNINKVEGSK